MQVTYVVVLDYNFYSQIANLNKIILAFVVSLFALAKALHLQYEWFLGPADVFPEEGADELPEGQAELLPLRHQKCGHQDQQM